MMEMTIKEFCEKHHACSRGQKWAIANCQNMQDVWDTATPERLVWVAMREGVLSDKELRLLHVGVPGKSGTYWTINVAKMLLS